jgi:hypothetical protein
VNLLRPTTTRSAASISSATRYADVSISRFWKPASIASTADPNSATRRISASAAASISAVIASTT